MSILRKKALRSVGWSELILGILLMIFCKLDGRDFTNAITFADGWIIILAWVSLAGGAILMISSLFFSGGDNNDSLF